MIRAKSLISILKKLDKCDTFVEVGVFSGKLTKKVLKSIPRIKTYYCIDPWEHYKEWDDSLFSEKWKKVNFGNIFNAFRDNIKGYEDKVKILRMTSMEALKQIQDESVDAVFIDGNHAYEYAKEDINGWIWKVREGGIISGHDYAEKYGVKQAVDETIKDVKIMDGKVWYKECEIEQI